MRALLFLLFVGLCQSQSTQRRESFDREGCWKVDALYQERLLMRNTLQSHKERQSQLEETVQQLTNAIATHIPNDCGDLHQRQPFLGSGVYTIMPSLGSTKLVYCDMTTDGGGWLVFQRRQDGSENFYRNWTDYQNGFGRHDGEFWLGNDALAFITNQTSHELRVDLEDFEGNKTYATYSDFSIAKAEDKYRLSLGSYSGNAGDSLSPHSGYLFLTYDQDNDVSSSINCAALRQGAWWYNYCHNSNLNGQYLHGVQRSRGNGVNWYHFKGYYYSLKFTEMKIRPK